MKAMASSGGKPRSSLSERQMVGLFSLGLGLVLFLLILMRGQQAAREGNQEISNDTYWVLVSPLVFSAFGVLLLRSPKAGAGARGRALEQSQRTTQSAQAAPAFVAAAPTAATGSDAFLSCYREACEELGVLPGSGW
jgi:hypothetical protein